MKTIQNSDRWHNSLSNAFGLIVAVMSGAIAIGTLVMLLLAV